MSSFSKVKLSLTCSHCTKISKNPVELPCGDLICQEHLEDKEIIKQNKIKCLACKQEFGDRDNKFNLSKLAHKQIENKIYLDEEEITLFKKIEESIKPFTKCMQTLI